MSVVLERWTPATHTKAAARRKISSILGRVTEVSTLGIPL
jgi:hypothetical protein